MSFVIIEFPQFICVQLLDMYSPTEAPCRKKNHHKTTKPI